MTNTKQFTLPPAFYGEHRDRDCGLTGRIVRETKRNVTVELDARAFADLLSDAELFLFNFGAGQFDGGWAFGLRSSAARTIEILKADPFSPEELAEAARIEDEEWKAGAPAREAERVRFEAQAAADRERRAAEAAAHPKVAAEYRVPSRSAAGEWIIGIPSNENLKVGTIITHNGSHFEVVVLGTIQRGGKVDVELRNRFEFSDRFAARLELGTILPGQAI